MKVRCYAMALLGGLVLLAACEGGDGGNGSGADVPAPADSGAPPADTGGPLDIPGPPEDVPAPPEDVPVAPPEDVPVTPPEDVPVTPPEDVPATPPDVPQPTDVPAPPPDVPAVPDVPAADVPAAVGDRLTVDCAVPYVLDGSRVSDMSYIALVFEYLIQQYCITGTFQGADITAFPEKMFYGSHLPTDEVLTLTQLSLQNMLEPPRFSVRVDFFPDTAVTPGSRWDVGLDEGDAVAFILGHPSAQTVCLRALATGGSLQFAGALNVTQTEGGSFRVAGTLDMVPARDVPDACEIFAASGLACCP